MSDSLGPHRLQHARLPCPSLSPRVCSNSCPLNHVLLILCHPLFLLSSIFPSSRVFSNELALPIRWPEYWSFSFSISLSNEYSALISFRIDWFDLAVQGTLKHILQCLCTLKKKRKQCLYIRMLLRTLLSSNNKCWKKYVLEIVLYWDIFMCSILRKGYIIFHCPWWSMLLIDGHLGCFWLFLLLQIL